MKLALDDLAVFGGLPAFAEPLHVGQPRTVGRERLLARLNDALDRRRLTNDGPFVRELEARLAERLGVRHCLATSNATAALEIVARAADLTGEVIVPAMTFVATAHALQWLGLTPVFADIDPDTHNLDPRSAEALITPRTSAILAVHLWGRACAVDELAALAERRGLTLLFDAAHALGGTWRGRPLGGFGRAEVFSFHATKFFHTFEGGAVATNDDALAARVRLMRNFGFAGVDQVVEVGINGKLNEISAAMGLTQLDEWDNLIAHNRAQYERYRARLEGLPGVRVVAYDPAEQHNYQYVVLEIDAAQAGLTRDELLAVLQAGGVMARRYFYPGVHRMAPYLTLFPDAGRHLAHTESLVERVLCLPASGAVEPAQVDLVTDVLRLCLTHPLALRRRLAQLAETWPLPLPLPEIVDD
jgi:dTDP-4-amino-4,6-dideoxygalactose transaminase